jgi:hypothetical protein
MLASKRALRVARRPVDCEGSFSPLRRRTCVGLPATCAGALGTPNPQAERGLEPAVYPRGGFPGAECAVPRTGLNARMTEKECARRRSSPPGGRFGSDDSHSPRPGRRAQPPSTLGSCQFLTYSTVKPSFSISHNGGEGCPSKFRNPGASRGVSHGVRAPQAAGTAVPGSVEVARSAIGAAHGRRPSPRRRVRNLRSREVQPHQP